VFKWKPRVWVVGFGLVDSLTLVPFNLHISLHLFPLVFCSSIISQTFGTRLKWGWLSKTPIFDHFPVGSTSHLHNTILQNDSYTCEYYLKHTSIINTSSHALLKRMKKDYAKRILRGTSDLCLLNVVLMEYTGCLFIG
jgi:hypothetical protein